MSDVKPKTVYEVRGPGGVLWGHLTEIEMDTEPQKDGQIKVTLSREWHGAPLPLAPGQERDAS